jgi:hypothetical protein
LKKKSQNRLHPEETITRDGTQVGTGTGKPGFGMDFGTRVFKFKTRKPGFWDSNILNVNYSS